MEDSTRDQAGRKVSQRQTHREAVASGPVAATLRSELGKSSGASSVESLRDDRLGRLRRVLVDGGLDAVIVSDPFDVRYLSGFRGEDTALLVSAGAALICTDARFSEQIREEVPGFELVELAGGDLVVGTAATANERVDGTIGYQGGHLTHAEYRVLRRRYRGRLRDVADKVTRLRAIKDQGELVLMRRAARMADEALAAVVSRGLARRTEAEVAWDLRAEYQRLGAEGEAFPAIVAGGAHGAQAHAIPDERVIPVGQLVVIDTGARVDGYCSDITRTFATGEVAPELRCVYETVLAAQHVGLAAVQAGAHGRRDVDAAGRAVIEAAGYGERFGHGTGHGVGLEVHEAPSLGRTRGDVLAAGMVVTVEPGVYLEGVAGVRIEDTVVVTDNGFESLTQYPKELQIVG
jgi:Xaa-Pro aminopeptidase